MASTEGASKTFRVFCGTTAYDVIFFKFQGGKCPLAPTPTGAHNSDERMTIQRAFNATAQYLYEA